MSRRRIALLVLLACVLPLGGWLLAGPALPSRTPRPAGRAIDIETPAGRARLDAALALAKMPDDPWTLAESLPPAPAASAEGDGGVRCGEDDAPVYQDPVVDADGGIHPSLELERPGGVGFAGVQRRIDAALRASGDPFDRSVADWLDVDAMRTVAGRLEALVADALATGEARSYALAFGACSDNGFATMRDLPSGVQASACAQLDAADWARRDPGNAVPWLFALRQADDAGDAAGQREALRRMASSSRFDVHAAAAAGAVARLHVTDDADLTAQLNLATRALGATAVPPYAALVRRCRDKAGGDEDLAALCDQIGALLFDHSDGVSTRVIGATLHKLASGDPSWLDRARGEQREHARHWSPGTGFSRCGAMRALLQRFAHTGEVGEAAVMREDLSRPVPP